MCLTTIARYNCGHEQNFGATVCEFRDLLDKCGDHMGDRVASHLDDKCEEETSNQWVYLSHSCDGCDALMEIEAANAVQQIAEVSAMAGIEGQEPMSIDQAEIVGEAVSEDTPMGNVQAKI
jgi:hypothetical protein